MKNINKLREAVSTHTDKREEPQKTDKKKRTPRLMPAFDEDEEFTGLFDLNDENVSVATVKTRFSSPTGDMGGGNKTVYFRKSELEHMEKLMKKYNMSMSRLLRTLVINAK